MSNPKSRRIPKPIWFAVAAVLMVALWVVVEETPTPPISVKEAISNADSLHVELLFEPSDIAGVKVKKFSINDRTEIETLAGLLKFEEKPKRLGPGKISAAMVIRITISRSQRDDEMIHTADYFGLLFGSEGWEYSVIINRKFVEAIIEHARKASRDKSEIFH